MLDAVPSSNGLNGMVFLFGTIRMVATILAVVVGAQAWPLWALAGAVVLHALAAYATNRAAFAQVQAQLLSDAGSDGRADTYGTAGSDLEPPPVLREFAYAFVRCGIAYFAGFWLFQLADTPS